MTTSRAKATDLEAALVDAYASGMKVTDMEEHFKVGRSQLYHILRRQGVVPSRTRRQLDAGTRDQILAGLHELIRHQDEVIAERDAEIQRLRRQLGNGQAGAPRRVPRKRSAS